MMTPDEMRAIVVDTIETQFQANAYTVQPPQRAVPRPPVSDEDLGALVAHLARRGIPLPPSYRQFLRLFDGIEGYRQLERFDLRSAAQVVAEADNDEEWDDLEPINRFVIGAGYATVIAGFDPTTADERGEMKVVEFSSSGHPTEHASFEAFLQYNLALFQRILTQEQQDRAGLADD
jgi:hypothetical protein